jgi:hypothetical protein
VCTWLVTIPVAEIVNAGGLVPFAPMSRVLEIIRALNEPGPEGESPAQPPEGT